MTHEIDIDSTDLSRWAERRDAQARLPVLLRRLVFATSDDLSAVSFPAGDAVALGGWDGTVVANRANAYVPVKRGAPHAT